ncbi:MAG: hypothetical protein K5917_07895 [Clostridiales bacterium]|nr:hypothetical protein [Clostridiales bacterium]
METFKKVLKVVAIIASIAAAAAGIYFAVTKLLEKKKLAKENETFTFTNVENDLDFIQTPIEQVEDEAIAQ